MALSDRDIIITPNRGASSEPIITLRGADAASSASMVMRVINSGTVSTLSFEGTSGQLFAVSDTLSGSIFSVNDVSGIPSIEVLDTGDIKLAEWNGKVQIGGTNNNENAISTSTGELQVVGGASVWKDMYVGGGMTVVGTLNAAVVTGTISNAANATNAANVAVTNDPSSGTTMYPTFVSATSGNQAIRVDSSGLVWIPSTNRLGIGTTSPSANVHIFSSTPSGVTTVPTNTDLLIDSSTNSYLTFRQSADIGAYGGIQWADNNVGAYILFRNFTAGGTAVGSDSLIYGTYQDHIFQAGTSGAVNGKTEVMRITQAGNVGIGDTTPTEKLVVAGSAVITGGVYGSETGAPDARIWSVSPANPTWGIFYNEGTPDFIEYKAAGTVTSRFALDTGAAHFGISGGFVGIGTDAPDIKLDVRGADTVIQAREDGTSSAWRARILSRNSSANKASFLGTYASIPGVFAHNYALSAWSPLYVNTTNGSTDGDNVIIAGSGNVGIGNNAPGRKLDVSGVTNVSSHITQGALISRPNVSWGASGSATGAVVIKFPGGTGNYGMIHAVIDIYTYDGENASTIIIGGHNWNSAWYNFGATRIGAFSKGVRLGFKDGQYCIVLGTNTSTWSYGQVVVRKIQNGSYYSGIMDLGGTYSIALDAAAESYTYISSNLITTGSAGGGGWNSGNDGSGSGLDADLIDGLDSTAFLRRDVTNTMFAGQTSQLRFENLTTFFRFAFNDLRFYDLNNGADIFGLDEHAYATTSMRAPIFYDRDNTAFYLDAAATGKALLVNGNIELTARSESWAEGIRINVPTAGTWGGIRINRSGASGPGNWAIGYTGLNSTNDLTFYSGTTNTIQVNLDHSANLSSIGSMRAPIFYDSNDTTYYLDPNADLSLRVYGEISNSNYAVGAMQPGALNIGRIDTNYSWGGSWSSDVRAGILANCLNNWEFAIHDSGERVVSPFAFFGGTGGQYLEMGRDIGWGTMPIIATNSFRAPIFYDQNNTAFYTDPASTSVVNNLTVNGTLTYTGTLAAGVDYARRLDNATRTAISVGGNASTFYPVVLQIGAGATVQQYGEFVIERGGYDDPGYTGVNFSTFNMRMSVKASGWGFGSTYENCEALYQNVQLVANWQQVSESSRLIIWLRGATVYYLWNVVGNTTLVNANAAGGNIVETNPGFYTYTFTPTTTINPKAQHSKYFNSGAFFDGNTRAFSLGVGTNASGTDGRLDVSSNVRAPIYYDLNDTAYYTDPASGSRLGYEVAISGNASGSVGNRLLVGSTTVNYSIQDGNLRPTIHAHGAYPVLTLNHTVTSNTNHGPTVQFTSNGVGNQFVIGMNGNGTQLDMGYASATDWNPHNGIAGYNGTTFFRATSGGLIGLGAQGDWGALGGGSPGYAIDTRGTLYNNTDVRAPIFYDANDTAYYADFNNGTTSVNQLGNTVYNQYGRGPTGLYSASRLQLLFSMGPAYQLAADGTTAGNLYGVAWSHPNAGAIGGANNLASHGMLILENGAFRGAWGGGRLVTTSDIRGTLFYDYNNTAFYVDPNGTSNVSGDFRINQSGSSGLQLISTTGTQSLWIRTGWDSAPTPSVSFNNVQFQSSGSSGGSFTFYSGNTLALTITSDYAQGAGSLRAPIFYDSNNTGFYVDPASTSNLNTLNVATLNISGGTVVTSSRYRWSTGLFDAGTTTANFITDLSDNGHLQQGFTAHKVPWSYAGNSDVNTGIESIEMAGCSLATWHDGSYYTSLVIRPTTGAGGGGVYIYNDQSSGYSPGWRQVWTSSTTNYNYVDVRAPIYYDVNDTSYYVNPNGESRQNRVRVGPYAGSTTAGNVTGLELVNNGGTGDSNVAAMSFHCAGQYAVHLHLRADSYFGMGGWSASAWRWYVQASTGNMTAAGEVTAYSDPRLKENIEKIASPLDRISKLSGVKFKWKEISVIGNPGSYDYGVIADEVEEQFPELVYDSAYDAPEGDKYKTVAYSKFVPILIEAIKEQQTTIDQLRAEMQELKEFVKQSLGK